MKRSIILKSVIVAAGLPLLAGCVEREVYREGPPPDETVAVDAPEPPSARVEVIPAPPGPLNIWFWVPGDWDRRGDHWFWSHGSWEPRPHPGAAWVRGGWVKTDHGRVWVRGHWR